MLLTAANFHRHTATVALAGRGFVWPCPEALVEELARTAVELARPPLKDATFKQATVLSAGSGGLRNTYALEYDDGRCEVDRRLHRMFE
jgi:hypothetical protein